jgi:glycosyltransferase involved in cell wall biosynthesis
LAASVVNEGEVGDVSILFDLAATQPRRGQTHGGAEYAKALFRRLVERATETDIYGYYEPNRHLDQSVRDTAAAGRVELRELRDLSGLSQLARDSGCEKLVSILPHSMHGVDLSGLDVYLAIHGLRPLECPVDANEWRHAHGISDILKWAAKTALTGSYIRHRRRFLSRVLAVKSRQSTIIVASQHTRFAMLNTFPDMEPSRIKVLYCPETEVSSIEIPDIDIRSIHGLESERYILLVSGGKWVKNAYRGLAAAIEVIESVPQAQGLKLAVAGGVPRHLPGRWRRHMVDLGRLSTAELAVCYKHAFCLLYPTLNEGFGYPPLEAMARGTPVLCSAIASTTEILGDAAAFFAPKSIPEMKDRLRMFVEDDAARADYSARGRARHAVVSEIQRQALDEFCDLLTGSTPMSDVSEEQAT